VNEVLNAGRHELIWSGIDDAGQRVASGLYLYRLETPDRVLAKKTVLLK